MPAKTGRIFYLLALIGLGVTVRAAFATVSYDHGDAPATYGDALHYVPAAPSSFLGTIVADGEAGAQNATNADGDDRLGTDDEDAFTSLPNLVRNATSYTLNVPCSGSSTVAGWIDLDKSGTFTNAGPNERASALCAAGTATLTWNTTNGNFPASLTVGTTYVRLRAASFESNGICQGKGLFGTAANTTSITVGGATSVYSYTNTFNSSSPGSASNVGSNGSIVVNGNGKINGNASATGAISGTVTGTKTTGAAIVSFAAVPACAPFSSGAGLTSTGNMEYSASTGDLRVTGNGTLTMAPGTYCFNSVKIAGNTIINISGPTTIYLRGQGDFSGGSFVNTTLNADDLRIFSSYSAISDANALKLTGGTQMYASVYAPNTGLTMAGGTNFNGCAVAGTVTLTGGVQFDQDLGLNSLGVANPTGTDRDGEAEDYPLAIVDPQAVPPSGFGADLACTGSTGDVSELASAVPLQIESGLMVFLGSRTPSPAEGHLKAYAVQSDGSVSTAFAWDAATLMTTSNRQNGLYSTDATGAAVLFNNLDSAAFATTTISVDTVKQYTLNPSYSSGAYLAGRRSGSYLGAIGRGDALGLITSNANIARYLDDPAYRGYFANTVSKRGEKVLAASDDGFLYAFNKSDGSLAWGWMPRSLVRGLQNYSSFQSSQFMRGKLDVIDVKDSSGSYASYIVGGYKNGLGHYSLKLSNTAGLASIVWDEDRSGSFTSAPNRGEAAYFSDGSGNTFEAYTVTNVSGLSTLVLRNVVTTDETEVALNFNATSTAFIMPDFGDGNGPARKTLYLGDSNGNIRSVWLLDSNGSLNSSSTLQSSLQSTSYPAALGAAEPVLFLGASVSALDGGYYLRAQSQNRLTLFKYNPATTSWTKRWTSYVGGAGSWDAAGTKFIADASGAPTDADGDGFATNVAANGIQSLPSGASIADAAQIVADSIVLPVSVAVSGACYGKTYYYFYRLTDGVFPANKFSLVGGALLAGDLALGYGSPTRVAITDMPSREQMEGIGSTDQLRSQTTGIPTPFVIRDVVSTGLRGWKELGTE